MAFTPVQKLSITSGGALTILGLVGLVSYLNTTQMIGTQRSVAATRANIARLERVFGRTQDAESAQRQFIVNGDTASLASVNAAQSDVEFALDSLRAVTEDNPDQRRNLDNLSPLIAARLGEIRKGVAARQRFGVDSALRILRRELGGAPPDGAGALFLRMRDEELRVLGERTRVMTVSGRTATNFILGGTLLAFVLALVALQPLRPSVAERLSRRLSTAIESAEIPELALTRHEALRHADDRLTRLEQVVTALNAPLTPAAVAQAMLVRGLPPLVASLGLVTGTEAGQVVVLGVLGNARPGIAAGNALPVELAAPIRDALRTLDLVTIETRAERVASYPALGRFADNTTTDGALVAVPLLYAGIARGAMLLAFADNRVFSDDERTYLGALGRLGGEALFRATEPSSSV